MPDHVEQEVKSATHNSSGREALKLRFTRLGARTASGSALVVKRAPRRAGGFGRAPASWQPIHRPMESFGTGPFLALRPNRPQKWVLTQTEVASGCCNFREQVASRSKFEGHQGIHRAQR